MYQEEKYKIYKLNKNKSLRKKKIKYIKTKNQLKKINKNKIT